MSVSRVLDVDTGKAGTAFLGGGTPMDGSFPWPDGYELARGVPFNDGGIGARYRGLRSPGIVVELFETNGHYEDPSWASST